MLGILFLGFLMGLRHALEADHVAAVAALANRSASTRQNVELAALWGAGHTLVLIAVAAAIVLLGRALPEQIAEGFEIAAGLILIALGIDVLRRLRRAGVHVHVHEHDGGRRHVHAHAHQPHEPHDASRHEHVHGLRPRALLIGGIHGMAGSAALTLVTFQTLGSLGWAVAYAALFGLGSIAGMVLFTLAISLPLQRTLPHFSRLAFALQLVLGLATIAIGSWMAVHAAL
ncbi:MAG TPA: hypothetical protein VEB21_11725 [Terriglobales bacterium]|nr:hypothetical protein [Terriglobales bacterium]